MLKISTLTLSILFALNSYAYNEEKDFPIGQASVEAPQSAQEFCKNSNPSKEKNLSYDPSYHRRLLVNSRMRMGFGNARIGIANGGVCWWHSLLNRNAAYLTYYSPNKAKPEKFQRTRIYQALTNIEDRAVIEITGFKNFHDFSSEYRDEMKEWLENWQLNDAVYTGITSGLTGSTRTKNTQNFKRRMDNLYKYVVEENNVAYVKLQLPGVEAHAWLILDMFPIKTSRYYKNGNKYEIDGYKILYVDSNGSSLNSTTYYEDQESMYYHGKPTIPYLERERTVTQNKRAIRQFCEDLNDRSQD